jgi:glutathione synthase
VRIGIVLTSAAAAAVTHTTVHLAQAALARGHVVRIFEPWDLEVDPRGRLRGRAHLFDGPLPREALVDALHNRSAIRRNVEVDRLDVLLLRSNPLDLAVIGFAQLVVAAGVRVCNDPSALVRTSHKAWVATLDGVPRPRTIVTRSRATIDVFASDCAHGIVVKPARACGGKGVTVLRGRRRPRLEPAIEAAARAGDGYVVVQEYVPAAMFGEKRLLWLDGRLVGGYLRQRAPGELRHNLKAGAVPMSCPLTDADHALATALTPHLVRDGVWFAGVDVIGGLVIEVNTLNPGGVFWSEQFSQPDIGHQLIASLEASARPPSLLPTAAS